MMSERTLKNTVTQVEAIATLEQDSITMMTAENIQDWLAIQIAKQIGIDPDDIDSSISFDSYGLNSVQIMDIASLGKQYFGLQLSPIAIWNYPTIELLSQYLAKELERSDVEILEL